HLMPVPLRIGGRTLGGALSWSTPQKLAAFEEQSPFAGLTVPQDVTITRQVLADPASIGSNVAVWARLADGTPLVTAKRMGDGQIVLFHVTANSDWSNLPISGLFVEMLRRLSTMGRAGKPGDASSAPQPGAGGSATEASGPEVLAPFRALDGFGTLTLPPPTAQTIPAASFTKLAPSVDHP
ncbi:MAG: LytTR family transcriptional regulator, partial [Rhodobacteraceae bacterium]|nr:LytTR family transcriptional regulator [Paracoccaceae bacterium]